MFSNEELRKMMQLAGVKSIPELQESDHIDLEIAVEPEDSGEPGDHGVPNDIAEPLAPQYEGGAVLDTTDDYGIPIDHALPPGVGEVSMDSPEVGEVPMDAVDGGEVVIALEPDVMGGEVGDCGCGAPDCPSCGGEMGMVDPHGAHGAEVGGEVVPQGAEVGVAGGEVQPSGDMTAAFAQMPDDDFIRVIQGGMDNMEDTISEFDNEDGEGSPVGSEDLLDDVEYMEVEEEYDISNGYDEQYAIDGEDYFPTGHDSNVRKKAGPLPGKADNNLFTTSLSVDEAGEEIAESLYNKYKSEYQDFLNENKAN